MLYHRPPRTYLTPPMAELELQPPPGKPARPTHSLMAVRCYLTSLSRSGIMYADNG